ncbi:MAG: PEP-CTERM sorting domain-containing protein [Erythrobacter sp.]
MLKTLFTLTASGLLVALSAAPLAAQSKPSVPTSNDGGTSVPEPAGFALLGLGLGLYFGRARFNRRKNGK